jgi:protein-S-isoprenylcysteine O-methyltransferase Ste14
VVSWLPLAGLTILLCIPIPIPLSSTGSIIARAAGVLLFLAGVLLILWGRQTLGPLWAVTTGKGVRLHLEHRLIRHGPYAIVRHPMYLGFRLLVMGTLVTYRTWVLAGDLAAIVPRFLGRARIEERALAAAFGQDWTDYASHVPMLIPWFPRRG